MLSRAPKPRVTGWSWPIPPAACTTRPTSSRNFRRSTRSPEKKVGGGSHQKILVLDATTGQNAFQQALVFHEAVGVDAVVLSKYDSSGKGGIVVAISRELGLPFAYFGTGERPRTSKFLRSRPFLTGYSAKYETVVPSPSCPGGRQSLASKPLARLPTPSETISGPPISRSGKGLVPPTSNPEREAKKGLWSTTAARNRSGWPIWTPPGRLVRARELRGGEAIWEVTYDPASGLPLLKRAFKTTSPPKQPSWNSTAGSWSGGQFTMAPGSFSTPTRSTIGPTEPSGGWERDGTAGSLADAAWTYGASGGLTGAWTVSEEDRAKDEHREWIFSPRKPRKLWWLARIRSGRG